MRSRSRGSRRSSFLRTRRRPLRRLEKTLIAHCQEHLIRWSCPREIEFRDDLPCTLVGKVAFNTLEQEEIAKLKAEGKYCGQ